MFYETSRKRPIPPMLAIAFVVVVVSACSTGAASKPPTPTPSPALTLTAATPTVTALFASPAPATPTPDPTITAAVEKLLEGADGIYGVVLMKPDGRVLYSRNANTPFVAASLYKLVLMAEIFDRRERGELKMDDKVVLETEYFPVWPEPSDPYFPNTSMDGEVTIEEALFATGAYSSNISARALLKLTSPEKLEQRAHDLGLLNTHLFVDPSELETWPPADLALEGENQAKEALEFINTSALEGPVNITTPGDMCLFFSKLMRGEIVNPHVSEEIFHTLEQQEIRDRFPALLPDDTRLVHKTGNLESVVHDVGIIYGPDGPVILAAMAEGQSEDDVAYQVIQRLASIAYGDYDPLPMTVGPAGGSTGLTEGATPEASPSP